MRGRTTYLAVIPKHPFSADATLTWNPVSRLRAAADFHQQNLVNEFVSSYSLAHPAVFYVFGNPSLHRHWAGLKVAYAVEFNFVAAVLLA